MTYGELKVAFRLVASYMWRRPGRVLLTSLSTIAAACIVVWVVSGYDSLVSQFGGMGDEYVGRYDLLLVPTADRQTTQGPRGAREGTRLPQELFDQVAKDPAVAAIDPVFETSLRATKPGAEGETGRRGGDAEGPTGPRGPGAGAVGGEPRKAESGPRIIGGVAQQRAQSKIPTVVGADSPEPVHAVIQGEWFDPKDLMRTDGAITRDAAEQMKVQVGDELVIGGGGRSGGGASGPARTETKVRVVAIVEQPKRLPGPKFMVGLPPMKQGILPGGPSANALYVPIALAERLSGATASISYAGVILQPGQSIEEFQKRWAEPFGKAAAPVEVRSPAMVDSEVDNSTTFETVRAQAYSATAISLMAALFIIFTTLSMGVDERIRQLAMLRAVSFTKAQVGVMILAESLFLGLIGWLGGLLAGWALLTVMAQLKPELLAEGASLGMWCVVLSGACALGGSLAAAVLPAWRATSVSPLEAMSSPRASATHRLPWVVTALGLALIAVNPLVVFYVPMADASRYLAGAAIGSTTMVLGFVMLAPAAVILTERLLGPVLAWVLRLNPRLLATQLSANMWRTVGTTVAMTIGLGLFVATQTWGYSMLAPFTPGDWAPDLILSIPGGVTDAQVAALQEAPGLKKGRFLPIAYKQMVKFSDDPTGSKIRMSATRQDTCMMVGVDPEAALGGADPVFKFRFVEGTRDEAIAKLKQGRYCLVPDHFTRESGLGVGQKFGVLAGPDERVDYEIAGVVSMDGWHWLTKAFRFSGRAAGLMLCPQEVVRKDFGITQTTVLWGDMDGSATEDEIKTFAQAVVGPPPVVADADLLDRPRRGSGSRGGVTLKSAETVRREITGRADNIIWALGELPLITLLVTALGVMNTVLSSIRARQWDMGVLRTLGVTRFGLFRLIVAEALLIGVVACVLSLGFGLMAGYCGTGITRYVNIRGGQYIPLIVPWAKLWIGFGIAVSLCTLAALWPAFRTGRTEPLRLLQAGRAAT